MKFGLIGYPLSHSFSKKYFNEKFKKENLHNFQYLNFEIENLDLLDKIITNNPEIIGLNVTIPYKEKILKYLDEIDETADEIAAVNTIKIIRKNNSYRLNGYNTDVYGFDKSIEHILNKINSALILGSGGASKAVAFALKQRKIKFLKVSRLPEDNQIDYNLLNKNILEEYNLIINTTPLGMFPNIETMPNIPYEILNSNNILYDLTYNPEETKFLQKGKKQNCITINGLQMLELQAEKSWEIWNK